MYVIKYIDYLGSYNIMHLLNLHTFLKFGTGIQLKTKFPITNLKLIFSIQTSCAQGTFHLL